MWLWRGGRAAARVTFCTQAEFSIAGLKWQCKRLQLIAFTKSSMQNSSYTNPLDVILRAPRELRTYPRPVSPRTCSAG